MRQLIFFCPTRKSVSSLCEQSDLCLGSLESNNWIYSFLVHVFFISNTSTGYTKEEHLLVLNFYLGTLIQLYSIVNIWQQAIIHLTPSLTNLGNWKYACKKVCNRGNSVSFIHFILLRYFGAIKKIYMAIFGPCNGL